MKLRTLTALVLTLLAVSACIIAPLGDRGDYRNGHHEHGVWRG